MKFRTYDLLGALKMLEGSEKYPIPPGIDAFRWLYAEGLVTRDPFTGTLKLTSDGKKYMKSL